jgi:hypothetical protein
MGQHIAEPAWAGPAPRESILCHGRNRGMRGCHEVRIAWLERPVSGDSCGRVSLFRFGELCSDDVLSHARPCLEQCVKEVELRVKRPAYGG